MDTLQAGQTSTPETFDSVNPATSAGTLSSYPDIPFPENTAITADSESWC